MRTQSTSEPVPQYSRHIRHGRITIAVAGIATLVAFALYTLELSLAYHVGAAAVLLFAWGGWVVRVAATSSIVNLGVQRIAQGRFDEAEELFARATKKGVRAQPRAVVAINRALIALWQSRFEDARRLTDEGVRALGKFTLNPHDGALAAYGLALRGFSELCLGNVEAGERDASTATANPHATVDTLAVGHLVHAMTLSRRDRLEELGAYLRTNAMLLHEHTPTRMRAIVRSLEARVRTRKVSAYRDMARPEEPRSAVDDWVSGAAPEAVGAPSKRTYASAAGSLAVPEAAPIPSATRRTLGLGQRILILWVGLIFAFLFIWHLLQPADGARLPAPEPSAPEPSAVNPLIRYGLPIAIGLAVVLVARLRVRWLGLAHHRAQRMAALGDLDGARAAFTRASRSGPIVWRLRAHHELATIDYRAARFREGIVHADAGASFLRDAGAGAEVIDAPILRGDQAILRAASGDTAGAKQYLAELVREHPGSPRLPSLRVRVLFVCAVRDGDRELAAKILEERTLDMGFTHSEELLADLVLDARVTREERERPAFELTEDPEVRHWLTSVAPELVESAVSSVRIASG